MLNESILTLLILAGIQLVLSSGGEDRTLQNVGWFIGYDPSIATPFPSPQFHDEGYKQPIFKFNEFSQTADGRSMIPDHTDFHRELQCTGKIDVDIIDTYERYLSSLQRTTSVNNHSRFCRGFWFFKKCYNFGYGFSTYSYRMEEHITQMKRGLIQASAKCGLYWGQVLLDDLPDLQPGFVKAIAQLPDQYDPENPQAFHYFFQKYGTHFISKVYLGSEIGKFFEVSQETLNTVRDDLKKYNSWRYSGAWGISFSSTSSSTPETSSLNYVKKQSYSETSYSKGVVIPESDNIADWMKNIEQEPTPIKMELSSISDTFAAIEERGLIEDFELDLKREAYQKAVEDYFRLREQDAKNNSSLQPFGQHEATVDPSTTLGYCAFCTNCGGKFPMRGGWIDHAGGDFWGFGVGCAGADAHHQKVGSHQLCCTRANYEKQGYCRYVFLEDHINSKIQHDELTLQGSVTVSGNPHVYSLTGQGYVSYRTSVHQIGLACTNRLCSLCTSCGGLWPNMQSGYWQTWQVYSRGAQCNGDLQSRTVKLGARLCCRNTEVNHLELDKGVL